MFPSGVQKLFSWLVPAFIGTLGVAAIRVSRSQPRPRRALNVVAGACAITHAVSTIVNLRVQGNARGSIPFSSGATGYGPASVPLYFLAQATLTGALTCWALAALTREDESTPLTAIHKPLMLLVGAVVLVAIGYSLLETFG